MALCCRSSITEVVTLAPVQVHRTLSKGLYQHRKRFLPWRYAAEVV